MLEANFDRNKTGLSLSQMDEYEEGIKQSLKKGMEVVGTLDTLGEDIIRLKFTMEAMPVAGGKGAMESVSAVGGQEGAAGASRVNFTSATGAMLSGLIAFTAPPQAPPSAASSSCSGGSSSATVRDFRDTSCKIADNVLEWLSKHFVCFRPCHQSSSSFQLHRRWSSNEEAKAQPSLQQPIPSFRFEG
jgi:hypothetical protein